MSTKNLTQVQVAELAGLTDRGLRYLEAEGAGPMREPDGSYRPDAVAIWLRSRTDRRARSSDPADAGNPLRDLHNLTVNHFVWSLFTHGAQLLAGEVRDTAGTDPDTARRVLLRLFGVTVLCADAYLSGQILENEIGEGLDSAALRILGVRLTSQPPQPGAVEIPLPAPVIAALFAEAGSTHLAENFTHWSADPEAVRYLLDGIERERAEAASAA